MQFILMMTIMTTGILFSQMKHPLSMGMMLMIQTILISLLTGFMFKTFWFSYILFLIFLGGMLVLFIYVTSLASNEMFSISKMLIMNFLLMIYLTFIFSMILDYTLMTTMMNYEMESIMNLKNFMKENFLILLKLYTNPSNNITLFMINYLFLTLIIIVKITNMFHGPLRPSF